VPERAIRDWRRKKKEKEKKKSSLSSISNHCRVFVIIIVKSNIS